MPSPTRFPTLLGHQLQLSVPAATQTAIPRAGACSCPFPGQPVASPITGDQRMFQQLSLSLFSAWVFALPVARDPAATATALRSAATTVTVRTHVSHQSWQSRPPPLLEVCEFCHFLFHSLECHVRLLQTFEPRGRNQAQVCCSCRAAVRLVWSRRCAPTSGSPDDQSPITATRGFAYIAIWRANCQIQI